MEMKPLPKLFIGSSSEQLDIVDAFAEVLSRHANCIPWNLAPEFKTRGSFTTFNALCAAAKEYDFALFILTADDELTHRGETFVCPRDNVVFEMGLFIGNIGPERVLAVLQKAKGREMKLPTDLLAVNMPRFSYNANDAKTSIGSINAEIQGFAKTIKDLAFLKINLNLAVKWYFVTKERHFAIRLGAGKLADARSAIGDRSLAVVGRIDNPIVNFEDDDRIVFAPQRSVPDPLCDMLFQIHETALGATVAEDTELQGRVLLVPNGIDCREFATLRKAVQYGCRVVETISFKVGKQNAT